ncbi:NPCBM/NEW2 domain-containing protein [Cohnella hashimotonis]|uniref:NPCBM/NEW2 domain-containing protein n=1 Tax=Cohnella hashimotonis TaxID=2826895 RepID=A0ABT6TLZ8_9BACL|nr:NPCBM/NEW2 domain-containing protein [Cohnella hashimotonis]
MKDKVKGIAIGLVVGSLISSSAAIAASSIKIDVVFQQVKYMIDGVQKPSTDAAITYKGQLYVPLKDVTKALGKELNYDSKNSTAWIGKKPGSFKYLSDISYARLDAPSESYIDFNQNYNREKIQIASNVYQKGINFNTNYFNGSIESIDYNLNGQYKKFTAFVGIDDKTKNSPDTVSFKFIGDDNELLTVTDVKGGNNPIPVSVDLTGVLKLRVIVEKQGDSFTSIYASLADGKLFQ